MPANTTGSDGTSTSSRSQSEALITPLGLGVECPDAYEERLEHA